VYCTFPDGTLGVKSTPDKTPQVHPCGQAAGYHRLEYPSETEGYGISDFLGILVQFTTVWEAPAKDLCPFLHIQNRQYGHKCINVDHCRSVVDVRLLNISNPVSRFGSEAVRIRIGGSQERAPVW
jgi:hypothetical protein